MPPTLAPRRQHAARSVSLIPPIGARPAALAMVGAAEAAQMIGSPLVADPLPEHPHPLEAGDRAASEPRGARLDVLLGVLLERGEPYSHNQSAIIVCKLATTLEAFHRQGVVHGEVRLSNVRMVDMLQPVLANFASSGATKRIDWQTQAGVAPEQVMRHPIDARTDVFALGAMLYEMLTGCAPLGNVGTKTQYLHACATLAPPAAANPGVPVALSAITMRALRPLPLLRYARAADMAVDLQRYLKHVPRLTPPSGPDVKPVTDRAPHVSKAAMAAAAAMLASAAPGARSRLAGLTRAASATLDQQMRRMLRARLQTRRVDAVAAAGEPAPRNDLRGRMRARMAALRLHVQRPGMVHPATGILRGDRRLRQQMAQRLHLAAGRLQWLANTVAQGVRRLVKSRSR